MKKRLLITSALMTAVLGASLATGTYAWYQVTADSSATATEVSATVGVLAPDVSIGALEFTITIGGADYNAGAGKLASVDLTDNEGASKYYVTNSQIPEYSAQKASGSFTVTISDNAANAVERSAYAATYTFNIQASGNLRIAEDQENVYKDAAKAALLTVTYTINADGTVTHTAKTVYYSVAAKTTTGVETENDHLGDGVEVSLAE